MISLDYSKDGYRIYRVNHDDLPKNTYVFCSQLSRDILYNPQMAGKALQDKMEHLGPIFIEIATQKALKGTKVGNVVEMVLLAGGLYYSLASGFKKVHNCILPQCFLGIKRQRVEGSEGQFTAVSTYENFESLPTDACVIIGDTIATGSTLIRSIGDLERAVEEKSGTLKKLIICSLACGTDGARKLRKLEERLKEKYPGLEIYLIVAEQLFHLMPDGTDLRFLREDALMPDETREYTLKQYGQFLGKEMKCAVFDWGTRCKNPKKHYDEFLEFCEEILKDRDIDEKGRKEIERMKKETLAELDGFNRAF